MARSSTAIKDAGSAFLFLQIHGLVVPRGLVGEPLNDMLRIDSQHKSLLVTQGRVEIEENTDDQVQLDVSLKGDKLIFGFKTLAKKLATREMAIAEFKAMAALSPPGDFSPHSVRITKAERTFNDFFGRPKVPGPKIRFNDAGCYHLLRLIKNQLG